MADANKGKSAYVQCSCGFWITKVQPWCPDCGVDPKALAQEKSLDELLETQFDPISLRSISALFKWMIPSTTLGKVALAILILAFIFLVENHPLVAAVLMLLPSPMIKLAERFKVFDHLVKREQEKKQPGRKDCFQAAVGQPQRCACSGGRFIV